MKKFYFVVVLTAIMLSIAPVTWAAMVEFAPAKQTVYGGESVFVDLNISELGAAAAPSLGIFDLNVSFDPTILNFSGVTYGDADLGDQLDFSRLGAYYETSSNIGAVGLYGLSYDVPEILNRQQADEFTLARLTFQARHAGTSALGISIIALGDADANILDATTLNGSIEVIPEPPSLLLLAFGLTALISGRRKNM